MPEPRDPRRVRHRLVVLLRLTMCAVVGGATSLLAVGEWIADAPAHVFEAIGLRHKRAQNGLDRSESAALQRLLGRLDVPLEIGCEHNFLAATAEWARRCGEHTLSKVSPPT